MPPAVSVILPCYNHEAFVRDAVDSVLRQTVSDIEIIAIDDCSTDNTAKLLESVDDPRFTVIRHESNRGSAETVNEGLRKAQAPYIAILNSDDLFWSERLAVCLETAQSSDALLMGTDLDLVNAEGEVIRDREFWWLEWYWGLKDIYRMSGDLTGTLIDGNIFISTSNFFMNRQLIQAIGPLADYRYVQDYEFLLRALAAYPRQVLWLEKTLLSYRLHGRNTILDNPLIPAQQTLEILAHWLPELAVGDRAAERLRHFETHLLKLKGYIEKGVSDQVDARWQPEVVRQRRELDQVYASLSFRFGHRVLQPYRWLRGLFAIKK